VDKIQAQLAPGATITHNVKLTGKSGVDRQIDVLVEQKIGQYEMRIVLDAKDHKAPVDINDVESFHGLLLDVGAHKGALVCPGGFTEGAKKRARDFEIDLYSPVDTDPHKWQAHVSAP
jgi:restriction endonuclease Mrr